MGTLGASGREGVGGGSFLRARVCVQCVHKKSGGVVGGLQGTVVVTRREDHCPRQWQVKCQCEGTREEERGRHGVGVCAHLGIGKIIT